MKIQKYISRVKTLLQGVRKQEKVRFHSHVILMSPVDYDYVVSKVIGKDNLEGKYMTIAKALVIKMPNLAKKKFQLMKWKDYIKMWEKYDAKHKALMKQAKEKSKDSLATPPVEIPAT